MHLRQVEILLPNGISELLCLPINATVRDLKMAVEIEFGIPLEMQILEIKGDAEVLSSEDWISLNILDAMTAFEIIIRVDKPWLKLVNSCLNKDTRKIVAVIAAETENIPLETRIFVSLFISISQRNNDFVSSLINEVKLTCLGRKTLSGRTLLHVAAAHNNTECGKALLLNNGGFNLISTKDLTGETPVDIATKLGFANFLTIMRESPLGEIILGSRVQSESDEASPEKTNVSGNNISPGQIKLSKLHTPPYRGGSRSPVLPRDEGKLLSRRGQRKLSRTTTVRNEVNARNADSNGEESPRKKSEGEVTMIELHPGTEDKATLNPPLSPVPPTRRKSSTLAPMPLPDIHTGKENTNRGLEAPAHLPPRRSRRRSAMPEMAYHRPASKTTSDEVFSMEAKERVESAIAAKKKTRAVSVGTMSAQDLEALQATRRISRPWNEYLIAAPEAAHEPLPPTNKVPEDEGCQKRVRRKSFQEWVVQKAVDETSAKVRAEEEKKREAVEKLLKEEARRVKSKTFQEWLQIKERENELIKEEEKKREELDKVLHEKQELRKAIADAKYQRWMEEKFEAELAKEIELRRVMEEKWKKKEKEWEERKAAGEHLKRRPMRKSTTAM